MSDTPETDAAELIYDGIVASGYADADVCRKLERERDEAMESSNERGVVVSQVSGALIDAGMAVGAASGFGELVGQLAKERDEAREDAKRATYWAAQETIKVSTVKSHWIEACRERDEAREALLNLSALVRRLFALLETVEVSDSEREFHPTVIRSCRVAHTSELAELLPQIKGAAK